MVPRTSNNGIDLGACKWQTLAAIASGSICQITAAARGSSNSSSLSGETVSSATVVTPME